MCSLVFSRCPKLLQFDIKRWILIMSLHAFEINWILFSEFDDETEALLNARDWRLSLFMLQSHLNTDVFLGSLWVDFQHIWRQPVGLPAGPTQFQAPHKSCLHFNSHLKSTRDPAKNLTAKGCKLIVRTSIEAPTAFVQTWNCDWRPESRPVSMPGQDPSGL